jgi:F0F1-type ATP synthase assembly protein I
MKTVLVAAAVLVAGTAIGVPVGILIEKYLVRPWV